MGLASTVGGARPGDLMEKSEAELVSVVRAHARRRHRVEAVRLALLLLSLVLLVATLAAVCVVSDVVSASSLWLRAALVLLALIVPCAALACALRPVKTPAEAKQIDDALGLKDRLTSALSFLSLSTRTPFQRAAVVDANRHLNLVRSRRDTDVVLRQPLVTLLVVAIVAAALFGVAWRLRPVDVEGRDVSRLADRTPRAPAPQQGAPSSGGSTPPEKHTDDGNLEEVEATTLSDEAATSAFTDAELKELEAMRASETSDADRLLAQAAYLDESDLSDSGLDASGDGGDDERMMMKEPDMDMIREMVKEAQKRKKEGQEQDGGEQIKLEILIKTHAASSGKRPPKRPPGRQSSGGGGGPSQDTRIKPRRIPDLDKVAFKVTSVRSLTPSGTAGGKRVVLSEAIMRTSGTDQPYLVGAGTVMAPAPAERSAPIFAQSVPGGLRAIVSKYFEGLKQLQKTP